MNEEFILKAMQMFDIPEKWNAFSELCNKRDELYNRWWKKLQTEVYQRELKNGISDWDVFIERNWDIRWFVRGTPNTSFVVHFWYEGLRISSGYGYLDVEKVNHLFEDQRLNLIKACFDRIDDRWHDTPAREIRNFSFGSPYDGKFPDNYTLSWYAGNRTEEFANQLIAKVRKFQTTEITALFKEINDKCKKEN